MKITLNNETFNVTNATVKHVNDSLAIATGNVNGKAVEVKYVGNVVSEMGRSDGKPWLGKVRKDLIAKSGVKGTAPTKTKEKLPKGVHRRSKNGSYSFSFWAWNGEKYTCVEKFGFKNPSDAATARAAFVEKCRKENGEIVNSEFMKRLHSGSRKVTTEGSTVILGTERIDLTGMPQTVACKLLADKFREYDKREADRQFVNEFFAEFIA